LLSPEEAIGSLPSNVWRYIYPIVIVQDTYFNDTVDAWNGSDVVIDEDVGAVLATSFAAGKKDSATNKFSGVILGSTTGVGSGLFGFNQGVNTFGFKDTGECWIGKDGQDGNGYIKIDANGNFKADLNNVDLIVKNLNVNAGDDYRYLKINSSDSTFEIGRKLNGSGDNMG
jgi:hypothetical protein